MQIATKASEGERMDEQKSSDQLNAQLNAQLLQLVETACAHPPGSPQRQRGLTQIVRLVTPKLWRASKAYYADALQQTWIYFCRNLCEATTGRAYDSTKASIPTWLNAYLKRRLQDFQIDENKQKVLMRRANR